MRRSHPEYIRRVNHVIDLVGRHLAEDLPLQRLAPAAALSPFHFHRVFKAVVGETLFEFVRRLRIEKGAQALLAVPNSSVAEVASRYGFASAATFARAFRAHFGMTASEWRQGGYTRWRVRHEDRKPSKGVREVPSDTQLARTNAPPQVRVVPLPSYRVAYLRSMGPYGARVIPQLWRALNRWTDRSGLPPTHRVFLGMIYDHPAIAAEPTLRYDAAVAVPPSFAGDSQVNVIHTVGSLYAVSRFQGTAHEIAAAWRRTFAVWLPHSGYRPDDKPCLELYRSGSPVDHSAATFTCDLCVPVRRP